MVDLANILANERAGKLLNTIYSEQRIWFDLLLILPATSHYKDTYSVIVDESAFA
jgi:hypothetical protein